MRLYTDIDEYCCEVLKARVADGGLPPGEVWRRDIKTLTADELRPFSQVHLFAGIGGSPLGFRWAGWPDELSLVTGGFPCQDISSAGLGAGLEGSRSRLFWEFERVVSFKRPDGLLAENVGALSSRGLDRVVGALESLGYIVHALRLGSWAIGGIQRRERWWITGVRADAVRVRPQRNRMDHTGPDGPRPWAEFEGLVQESLRVSVPAGASGGVSDGVLRRMDRLRGLGNSQDPRVVEVIARAMIAAGAPS